MILAILVAGVAAAVFAVGISLQHRAAGTAGQAGASTKRWLMELARGPSWLVGIGLSAVGFGLHSAALALGSVALVQPIVVSATVFAVLLRAWLDRQLPALAEVGWATCTWAGLVLFLPVTTFRSGQPMVDGDVAGILLAGGVAVAAACALGGWRTKSPVRRGVLWGAAAGVLFGLVAGLLKIVITQVQGGVLNIADHWPVWALLVTGGSGLLLNQRACRAARLSVSMPVLNLIRLHRIRANRPGGDRHRPLAASDPPHVCSQPRVAPRSPTRRVPQDDESDLLENTVSIPNAVS